MRAIRSLVWNRALLPIIEDRIFRAEQLILAYLAVQGSTQATLGGFQIELVDEAIQISQLPTDDWRQMPLPKVRDNFVSQESNLVSIGS